MFSKFLTLHFLLLYLGFSPSLASVEGLHPVEIQDLAEILDRLENQSVAELASKGDHASLLAEIINAMCDTNLKRYEHLIPDDLPEGKEALMKTLGNIVAKIRDLPGNDFEGMTLFESLLNQGMARIDPYFEYSSVQSLKKLQTVHPSGRGSMGFEMVSRKGRYFLNPAAGSPSELAGMESGDQLISVDGTKVVGRTFTNVRSLLLKPVGSQTRLVVARDGELTELSVVGISSKKQRQNEITTERSYIKIKTLDEASIEELKKYSKSFDNKKLTLDFRSFSGATTDEISQFCELFVAHEEFIYHEKGSYLVDLVEPKESRTITSPTQAEKIIRSTSKPLFNVSKIEILQDQFTASAAEAIIVALKNSKRFPTETIGVKTFGKATICRAITLTSGSEIFFSVKHFLKPDGASWETEGLTPDIIKNW